MIPLQIILISIGALLVDANECNCDCDGNGVCEEQTALRTELNNFSKWDKYYVFVRGLEKNWQNQMAHVARQQLQVGINETIEGVKNALQRNGATEEQAARIESLEKSFRALDERASELDITMEMLANQISGVKTELRRIQRAPKCGVDIDNTGARNISDPVWPWMASVYKNGTDHVCYGSVIHPYFVLTTAWCPFYSGDAAFTVKLGLSDLKNGAHVQEYKVQSFHIHPQFRRGRGQGDNQDDNLDYDIGLLELEEPIQFGPFVRPVCLPPRETTKDETFYQPQSAAKSVDLNSYIHPPHAESPRMVNLTILSQEACRKEIDNRRWGIYFPTPEFSFCAVRPTTCPFRGTPVVQSSRIGHATRTWTQVSLVILCVDNIIFGYRLSHLMPWVDGIIEPASKP